MRLRKVLEFCCWHWNLAPFARERTRSAERIAERNVHAASSIVFYPANIMPESGRPTNDGHRVPATSTAVVTSTSSDPANAAMAPSLPSNDHRRPITKSPSIVRVRETTAKRRRELKSIRQRL
jgi:hypothetical protein